MVIWHASGRKVKRLISWTYPKSLGLMYSAYTQAAGWKPNEEEYIMMGAASVTDHVDSDVVKQIESLWETGFNFHRGVNHPIKNKHDIDDIPAATQAVYERAFCKLLDRVTKMEQYNGRVVFVGGCALNVKANAHLASFFDQVYVPCNPGDGGSAIGSVLARHKKHIDPTPYMGKRIGGKYPVDNIIQELQQQMVVGVANGRAEFGPRSLGNRSLLADPRCKNIKDVVNDCKGRELFRPFAPMILKEDVSEYFSGGFDSPYMSCAWKATDDFSFKYPGVVHYDHTSRLQVVSDGPHRKLLEEWKIATGCPVILNTSLNVKGQPIVNDIGDCLAFTKRTGVLILN
jgi:carbamoyltransferase